MRTHLICKAKPVVSVVEGVSSPWIAGCMPCSLPRLEPAYTQPGRLWGVAAQAKNLVQTDGQSSIKAITINVFI